MSDTENKVKTKTSETAPYMKTDNQTESSKSNVVIPLVLLLVSGSVEYNVRL